MIRLAILAALVLPAIPTAATPTVTLDIEHRSATVATVDEDHPSWDCATMGNLKCGTVHPYGTRTLVTHTPDGTPVSAVLVDVNLAPIGPTVY